MITVRTGVLLMQAAALIYAAAAVAYIVYFAKKRSRAGTAGTGLLVLGILVHTAALVVRATAASRPPFMSVYEFILSFTLALAVVYLVIEIRLGTRMLGAFHMPLVALFGFAAVRMPSVVNPTMPALRSILRVPHISAALVSYAAFGSAFVLAIQYLIRIRADKTESDFWPDRLPDTDALDHIIYRTIALGFVLLTFAIVTGAVWAQAAWGKYWSWDNKEVWSAVTWLIYAAYLHTRRSLGWSGRRSALAAIVGFAAAMFTLFGVTYLLPSIHGYR
ncbi:MAG TPA: c-type cytochrome biogenesis protein CcsB [Armatimonadota bacterium]